MPDVRRGLIIVNTSPAKAKQRLLLARRFRAVGNGMRVLMLQFLKGSWHYGELDAEGISVNTSSSSRWVADS